jgi:vancomycin resistance protein VanW
MITKKFPFLLPLRVMQRKLFFYTSMRLDGRYYAKTVYDKFLPHRLFSADSGLYNKDTGFDMVYQENKVFNLKLVAKKLNGLLIKPGETFSFWQVVRHANKSTSYKDGLLVKDGELCVSKGGGLCQMSNLLFWMFLHSPLSIVERHSHRIKDFPTLQNAEPEGVDATINEGWLDLKVMNETDITFQICINFDDVNITGTLFIDKIFPFVYEMEGKELSYFRENDKVYQEISIYRRKIDTVTQMVLSESLLYKNICVIGYQLPNDAPIIEKRSVKNG